MYHAFFFGTLFIIDFVSHWFQVYSSYLVGTETHMGESKYESIFVRFYYSNQIVLFIVCFLSELYTFKFYMNFFPNHFGFIKGHDKYEVLMTIALVGAVFKNIVNVLQLVSSSQRIVGLDVKQKNDAIKASKTK